MRDPGVIKSMTIDPPTESETSEEHTPTTHTNAGQDVIAVDN